MDKAKNVIIILLTIVLIIAITVDLQSKHSYYADGFNEGFQHAKDTIQAEPTQIVKEKVVYSSSDSSNSEYDNGYDDGYDKGREDGYHSGYQDGYDDGYMTDRD